jgi:hypothetical protein
MDAETSPNPEEFPKIRYEEKLLLWNCPLNIYSIGRPPAPELLREVEKRFDDRRYRLAWKYYVELSDPWMIYKILENEPGLWAKVRPWIAKDLEDVKKYAIERLGSVEKFERIKQLFLEGRWDDAADELEAFERERQQQSKPKELYAADDSDPADWWKG